MKQFLSSLSFLITILICNSLTAQNPVVFEDWTTANGTQNMFVKTFTETDTNNNVYIGGATVNGSGNYDILLTKYDPRGVLLWTQQYAGAGNGDDGSSALCFGDSGNVYITGTVYTSSTYFNDCVVLKYDKNGNLKWAQTFNGSASNLDAGTDICIDEEFNVYVGGTCTQTNTYQDFLVLKYDKNGQLLWNNSYNGISLMDISNKISLNDGDVIVAGGTQTTATKWEYAITKFTLDSGLFVNVTTTNSSGNGIDKVTDLTTDQNGNLYVTGGIVNIGTGYDYHTVKLDSNLVVQWASTYNGNDDLDDIANAVEIDDAGHVFVTGYSTTANQGTDIVTIRYSSTGVQQGIHTYNDPDNGDDSGEDMLIDDSGNVYITGYAYNGSNLDYHTFKLESNTTLIWEIDYNGIYNNDDKAMNMCLDDDGDLIIVGQSDKGEDEMSFITIKYIEKDITMPPDTEIVSTAITYVENRGQLIKTDGNSASTIKYYSQNTYPDFYFADENFHMVLSEFDGALDTFNLCRVDMNFHESTPKSKVFPIDRRDFYSNYYYAHIPKGRARIGNFDKLIYPDIYSNIDLIHSSNNAGWKFYYVIKPGGNPTDIEFAFTGNDSVYINNDELIIETFITDIIFPQGEVYQISSTGSKITLNWQPQYLISGTSINFTCSSYDTTKSLVIEIKQKPPTAGVKSIDNLEWSTYYGNVGQDIFHNVETNSSNSIWVNGINYLGDFPTAGGNVLNYFGDYDAVILNFNTTEGIEWATYYGGSNHEGFYEHTIKTKTALTVGSNGHSYISGSTDSDDIPFPSIQPPNAYIDTSNTNGQDVVYVAKFNEKGFLKWSTYFGDCACGYYSSRSHAMNIDNFDNLYVTGMSADLDIINQLPNTSNGTSFIAKFAPDHELIWSTQWGGTGEDDITCIEFNDDNDMYLAGIADSINFPVVQYTGSYNQPNYQGGDCDGFIARFVNDSPVWVTFMGVTGDDKVLGMHHVNDEFYVVGSTTSDFYTYRTDTIGYYDSTYNGDNTTYDSNYDGDGFFGKFTNTGGKLHISLYGGAGADGFSDVATDSVGNLIITGSSTSELLPFTSPQSSQDVFFDSLLWDYQDGIIISFDDSLKLQWTTYFGGYPGNDWIKGLTITDENKLYIVGSTDSETYFPLVESINPGAYYQDTLFGNYSDGFISYFNLEVFFGTYYPYEIFEFDDAKSLIYPNPASKYIYISSDKEILSYEIYSITGQQVNNGEYKSHIYIDNLTPGLYILNITLRNGSESVKFIKE